MSRLHFESLIPLVLTAIAVAGCGHVEKHESNAASTAPVPARAEGVDPRDRNRSGSFEPVEFDDELARKFRSLDTNQDGVLTGPEIPKEIAPLDLSHDRTISIIEFTGATGYLFSKADRDRDGSLSPGEMSSAATMSRGDAEAAARAPRGSRICVGDPRGRLISWELRDTTPSKTLLYRTLVPGKQNWTCVPMPDGNRSYVIQAYSSDDDQMRVCELQIRPNQWVYIEKKEKLNCQLFGETKSKKPIAKSEGKAL